MPCLGFGKTNLKRASSKTYPRWVAQGLKLPQSSIAVPSSESHQDWEQFEY